METNHLHELILLAELGSSYAAADKLFISQSSLVRHVQTIEEEFGMPLFDRTRRGFALNDAGKVFLPYAKKIVAQQEQCYKALHKGDFHENIVRLTAEAKIIDLIIDFCKAYPDYTIDYHQLDALETELHAGNVDVVFLSKSKILTEDIIAVPFYRESVLLLVYEGHPLYDRESVALSEICDETLIGLPKEAFIDNKDFDTIFRDAGFASGPNITVPVASDVIRMVREKMGLALVHGSEEEGSDVPGLRTIPLRPKLEYDVNMCYRTDVCLSRAAMDFIEFAKKWRIRQKNVELSFLRN